MTSSSAIVVVVAVVVFFVVVGAVRRFQDCDAQIVQIGRFHHIREVEGTFLQRAIHFVHVNAFFGKQRVIVEEPTSFVEQMVTAYIVTQITLSSLVKEERAV